MESISFDKGNMQSVSKIGDSIAISWGSHGIVSHEDSEGHDKYEKFYTELEKRPTPNRCLKLYQSIFGEVGGR